jgi:bifunctional DNA-binding transcriptional regulator/antitoxin component of YhaV-PrlF toxin-antitoxin module
MQHCRMTTTLPLSKRGSLTLPPELRRKMGLDKLRNPLVLVEERDGGLFLQPAVAMPVRDLPKKQIQAWIARDEADMATFKAAKKKS